MRSIVAFAMCSALAAIVTGCSSPNGVYVREGIGTNLSSPDLPAASYLQDVYVGEICRQAGLQVSQQGDVLLCDEVGMRPNEWATFVQAGMNDIDRRCDAYLTWLDDQRRSREPVLSEIVTTAATTAAILGLTGVGATPIAIVGAAFGFAKESFLNFQSRLLTQIDQAVVQSVVLVNQATYRNNIVGKPVNNRPAAIYLLRGYLRLCMPMSIEMHINNTMAVFQRGGAQALGVGGPILTQTPQVAKKVAANAPPPKATDTTKPPARPSQPSIRGYREIIVNYDPNIHSEFLVQSALRAICVLESDLQKASTAPTPQILHLIDIYEQTVYEGASPEDAKRQDHKLDKEEMSTLAGSGPCNTTQFRNYYEKINLRTPIQVTALIKALNAVPNGANVTGTSLQSARPKIMAVRDKFIKQKSLKTVPPLGLEDEVTVELMDALPQ